MLNKKEIIVILDNIRSVHNVGAIFRTCDGCGVNKIFLCGITPTPAHKKLAKTALGAEDYVEWEYFNTTKEAIDKAKQEGATIYSIEQANNSKDLNSIDTSTKSAFVFGNEITGVSPSVLEDSNFIIEIPMVGKKNSLNVSTCVGIVVYYVKMSL